MFAIYCFIFLQARSLNFLSVHCWCCSSGSLSLSFSRSARLAITRWWLELAQPQLSTPRPYLSSLVALFVALGLIWRQSQQQQQQRQGRPYVWKRGGMSNHRTVAAAADAFSENCFFFRRPVRGKIRSFARLRSHRFSVVAKTCLRRSLLLLLFVALKLIASFFCS